MSLCAQSVAAPLRVLRLVGFCRLQAPAPRSLVGALHRVYHVFALLATSTYVLLQFIYAYQQRGDMDKLSRVMFVLLCHVTCVSKQIAFHLRADRIDKLIARLDEPLMNQAAGAALLRERARAAARLLRVYAGCAVATCVLWTAFPVLDRIQGRRFEFAFWIGLNYDYILVFIAVLVYSFYSTNLVAVGHTSMDTFMAVILDQCKTQLHILRMNFETLPERARAAAALSHAPAHAALHSLLIECLLHYQKIIELCTELHEIFCVPLLVNFGVGGWILCMAAYKIVSLNVLSIEFASTTLFIICILMELFLFCYFGNEVTVESDRVGESIYSMEWRRAPLRFQRALLVVTERAKRPLRPTAGLIIPLTLDTFVTVSRHHTTPHSTTLQHTPPHSNVIYLFTDFKVVLQFLRSSATNQGGERFDLNFVL
ncbi:odorant receptor 4-like [Anticarsia gemmatalis]|uniref:odorant receptor 4-like n=1 Tax=Anticarsia gemmatalis TaxID=129554 RepID=UPI003F75F3BA